jgi:hypothetical protein
VEVSGAEKIVGILKYMKLKKLKIYHVSNFLQKYTVAAIPVGGQALPPTSLAVRTYLFTLELGRLFLQNLIYKNLPLSTAIHFGGKWFIFKLK